MGSAEGDKNPVGRPTDYKSEYDDLAYRMCLLLNATDKELAGVFDVTEQTINNWKNAHESFKKAIDDGKLSTDANVASKLLKRAMGAEWEEEHALKVKVSQHAEEVRIVKLKKAAPPDTNAASLWLRNRQPHKWRDKQEHELTGKDGSQLIPTINLTIGTESKPSS